jgi:hypothetical protein
MENIKYGGVIRDQCVFIGVCEYYKSWDRMGTLLHK